VTGQGPYQGELYFETSVGAFTAGVGAGIRVPLLDSDPRVEVRGQGRYEVRVQLQIPGPFLGRIDLDAWLTHYATRTRGRTFVVVRKGDPVCDLVRDGIAIPQSSTVSLAATSGDIDQDGDLDLVVGLDSTGADPSALRILINDGTGKFSDEALTRFVPGGGRRCSAVQLGDVDEDGDLDLLLGLQALSVTSGGIKSELWLNDGAGNFKYLSPRFNSLPVSVNSMILADMDEDGWLDIVVGAGRFEPQAGGGFKADGDEVRVYWNEGYGDFPTSHRVLRNCGSAALAAGDMNCDGRVDLAVGGTDTSGMILFRGPHRCWDPTPPTVWGTSTGLALFDRDGDGDLDWLSLGGLPPGAATSLLEPRLLLNDGSGTLNTTPTPFPLIGDAAQGRASLIADFNGDQRADVFLCFDDAAGSTRDLRNRLYFGGVAAFTLKSSGSASERSTAGALGDFDGDGDQDLFVANRDAPDHLLRNDLIK
jgi:VCBS repeat protein